MGSVGRYETVNQIGSGAMGTVYRARDTVLDREIALKIIRTGVEVDPQIRERFYREARACARLQHPNIIAVYDLGEAANLAYIAMELLQGADLRQVIEQRRAISLANKLSIIVQVCDAVAYAHRHGVIHRDIKPSNLFLTDDQGAKVLDFGIARLPSSRLTVAGQILGTPNYMAPEQILGRPADGRADLFSTAVVLFELLTYAHPFQSPYIPKRIAQSEPDSLFDHDSTLPVILDGIITRALAKDPERRYQTVDEFANDLRTVLDAVKQNASSTFSHFELPSRRAPAMDSVNPPAAQPAIVVPAPVGQDPDEWRLSEALRLLPEFETALENDEMAKARTIFAELESRISGDMRFTETLRLCRSRLAEMGGSTVVTKANSASAAAVEGAAGYRATAEAAPRISRDPRATGPAVGIDDAVFGAGPVNDTAPVAIPPVWTASPVPRQKRIWTGKRLVIGAGVVVCALLVVLALLIRSPKVPVEPAIAIATVHYTTSIFANPGNADGPGKGNKVIGVVTQGTKVNVLARPAPENRTWTKVQAVEPEVLMPGYVLTSALRE